MKPILCLLLCFCSAAVLMAGEPGRPPVRSGMPVSGVEALNASLALPAAGEGDSLDRPEGKNIGTAILYSLAVPGMGELYAGSYSSGKYFTIAEGTLWVTFIALNRYAQWVQDDARQFASQHAGITMNGQSDQFFADVGDYTSVQAHNTEMLRERDIFSMYNEHGVNAWSWDSPANLQYYRDRRITSDQWFNNTRFVVTAIVINHVVSAINAARIVVANNRNGEQSGAIDIRANVLGGITRLDGIQISLTRTF
jgi:hypothetical protein